MRNLALLLAGMLLLAGGGTLIVAGLRNNRRLVTGRLRRMLTEHHPNLDADRPSLALLWVRLTRRADALGDGSALFDRLEALLERSGWLLRPAEFVVILVGAAVGGVALGIGLFGSIAAALVLGIIPPGGLYALLLRRARRLRDRADAQLPEVLEQLASSLRAGHGLNQAVQGAADTMTPPLGAELSRVVRETEMGLPLEEALEAMADRIASNDLRWTVRAMVIQARTGGRLSEIFDVLAEFMRDREEVRREVKALTADGRTSALVLSALPFFVCGLILAVRPEYLLPMFSSQLGMVMLVVSGVLLAGGMVMIRKIVNVEV